MRVRVLRATMMLAVLAIPAFAADRQRTDDPVRLRTLDVAVREPLAFLAQTSGLEILDVGDLSRPKRVSRLTLTTTVAAVQLVGDRAYLAGGSQGLIVADIADPEQPRKLLRFDTPGSTRRVALLGTVAYLADGTGGLRVVDLSRPDRPREVATFASRSQARSLHLHGERLAVAEGTDGVRLFDVGRPDLPRELARVSVGGSVVDVLLLERHLLAAAGDLGVAVWRLDDDRKPSGDPVWVEPRTRALTLSSVGRHVVAGLGRAGMRVLEIDDDGEPRVVAETALPGSYPVGRADSSGATLYLAADVAGLAIVDLSAPTHPVVLLPRERRMRVHVPD